MTETELHASLRHAPINSIDPEVLVEVAESPPSTRVGEVAIWKLWHGSSVGPIGAANERRAVEVSLGVLCDGSTEMAQALMGSTFFERDLAMTRADEERMIACLAERANTDSVHPSVVGALHSLGTPATAPVLYDLLLRTRREEASVGGRSGGVIERALIDVLSEDGDHGELLTDFASMVLEDADARGARRHEALEALGGLCGVMQARGARSDSSTSDESSIERQSDAVLAVLREVLDEHTAVVVRSAALRGLGEARLGCVGLEDKLQELVVHERHREDVARALQRVDVWRTETFERLVSELDSVHSIGIVRALGLTELSEAQRRRAADAIARSLVSRLESPKAGGRCCSIDRYWSVGVGSLVRLQDSSPAVVEALEVGLRESGSEIRANAILGIAHLHPEPRDAARRVMRAACELPYDRRDWGLGTSVTAAFDVLRERGASVCRLGEHACLDVADVACRSPQLDASRSSR